MHVCSIAMPLAVRFEGWLIFHFYFIFLLLFVLQVSDTIIKLSEIKINNNINWNRQVLPIFQFLYLKSILMNLEQLQKCTHSKIWQLDKITQ